MAVLLALLGSTILARPSASRLAAIAVHSPGSRCLNRLHFFLSFDGFEQQRRKHLDRGVGQFADCFEWHVIAVVLLARNLAKTDEIAGVARLRRILRGSCR